VAARQLIAPSIHEQLCGATKAGSTSGASSALVRLLLTQTAEAALCMLEETEDGVDFGGPAVARLVSACQCSFSLVAPLEAVFDRLRWFYQQVRLSQPRVVAFRQGPAPPPGPSSTRAGPRPVMRAASVQTTGVSPEQQPPVVPPPVPAEVLRQVRSVGVQAGKRLPDLAEAGVQAGTQTGAQADAAVPELAQRPALCDVGLQTRSPVRRHAATQSSPLARDAASQTQGPVPGERAVRVVRISRLRAAEEAPEPRARSRARSGERVASPRLRCPAGHGLQWLRRPGRGECLSCSVCACEATAAAGFHACAVCFQDTGRRHVVCGACSRDRAQRCASQRLLTRAPEPGHAAEGLRGSASAGSLPLPGLPGERPKRKAMAARAAEWSLVSASLPRPPPWSCNIGGHTVSPERVLDTCTPLAVD